MGGEKDGGKVESEFGKGIGSTFGREGHCENEKRDGINL